MLSSRTTTWLATGMVAGILAACASGSGSQGISRGPSNNATVVRVAAPPDTVMQRAWEVLRNDGVQPRWFSRSVDDSTNVARMESDWIYVPRVLDSAMFRQYVGGRRSTSSCSSGRSPSGAAPCSMSRLCTTRWTRPPNPCSGLSCGRSRARTRRGSTCRTSHRTWCAGSRARGIIGRVNRRTGATP